MVKRIARSNTGGIPVNTTADEIQNAGDIYHLKVYETCSELVVPGTAPEVFLEGKIGPQAQQRAGRIVAALKDGFLAEQIRICRDEPAMARFGSLEDEHRGILENLVDGMTSEVGRALIGLSVLQLTIKAIAPKQNVRLHKGSVKTSTFGWREGLSMRTLDAEYITPVLRETGLLKLNAYGIFMTRTLAENYPYSRVYKAAIRGGRKQWIDLVEALESNKIEPLPALHYLISKLINAAAAFEDLAQNTIDAVNRGIISGRFNSSQSVLALITRHMMASSYAARIMEIAMHSLMQALQEEGALESAFLVPLSQMRSANKKHGNVGDVELRENADIIEAWDAKYGKSYLRDELEEINDKLALHPEVREAGFVTSDEPSNLPEIEPRLHEIEEAHGLTLKIISLKVWVDAQFKRGQEIKGQASSELAKKWILAYAETLALRRLKIAPIDEPGFQWLSSLNEILRVDQGESQSDVD